MAKGGITETRWEAENQWGITIAGGVREGVLGGGVATSNFKVGASLLKKMQPNYSKSRGE